MFVGHGQQKSHVAALRDIDSARQNFQMEQASRFGAGRPNVGGLLDFTRLEVDAQDRAVTHDLRRHTALGNDAVQAVGKDVTLALQST